MVLTRSYGQSNIDLALKAHGGLDNFIKFCKDNFIFNINNDLKEEYTFEDKDIVNRKNSGYNYINGLDVVNHIVKEGGGIYIKSQDNGFLITEQ